MALWDRAEDDAVIAVMKAARKARCDGTPWLLVRTQDGRAFEMDDQDFLTTKEGRAARDAFFNLKGDE